MPVQKIEYADDDTTTLNHLVRIRIPPLLIGMLLGILLSIATSKFEQVLLKNISIAYFIPFIIYIASAVGTQTESIYIRDLRSGHANLKKYIIKEGLMGLILASVLSIIMVLVVYFWFKSAPLATAVSLSMFATISIAPIVALAISTLLQKEHTDPAAGAGPIGTIIQDVLTVVIYGLISSWIIL